MRNQHIAINNAPFGYAIIELVRKGADGAISCKLAELNQTFEYLTGWILYSKTGNIFVPQFTIGNEVIESLDNLLAVVLDEGAGFEIHKYFGQSRKWLKVQIRKHGEEHIIIYVSEFSRIEMALAVKSYQPNKNTNESEKNETVFPSEIYKQAVNKTSSDGFWVVNQDGVILEVNQAYCEMSGFSREELLKRKINDFGVGETPSETKAYIEQLKTWGSVVFETMHKRKDESLFRVEVSATWLGDESGLIVCFFRNLTKRETLLNKLSHSEKRSHVIGDYSFHWEYWLAPDGSLVYISPSCVRISGYSWREFFEKPELIEDIIHKDDKSEFALHKTEAFQNFREHSVHHADFRIIAKDGTIVWINHVCQQIFDENGIHLGLRVSNQDITARKQAEERLRQSENRYRAVAESVSDFVFAYRVEGLEYKLEWIGGPVEELTGYSIAEIMEHGDWGFVIHPADHLKFRSFIRGSVDESSRFCVVRMATKEGEDRWFRLRKSISAGEHKGVFYLYGGADDVTTEYRAENERSITINLLSLINSPYNLAELMKGVAALMKKWSECSAVAIRLKNEDEYPVFTSEGYSQRFIDIKTKTCSQRISISTKKEDNNTILKCLCRKIIDEKIEKGQDYFSENGSFWTNSITLYLATLAPDERILHSKYECFAERFETMALIPIRKGSRTFGLLQFNDPLINKLDNHKITILEQLASNLAIALSEKQALNELRQSEEKYRSLFEANKDGIAIFRISRDGKPSQFIEANKASAEMLGYSRYEFLCKTPDDLEAELPEDKRIHRSSTIQQKGFYELETRLRHNKGHLIDVSVKSVVIDYLGSPAILNITRDISLQKKAERALKESEEKYRRIAENVSDVVWVSDLALKIIYVSPSIKRMTGFSAEEFIWLSLEERFPQSSINIFRTALAEEYEKEGIDALQHRTRLLNVEQYCADGSTIWVSINCSFTRNDEGEIVGIQGVTREISEQMNAERRLEESFQKNLAILRVIPDMMFVLNKEGCFVDYYASDEKALAESPDVFLNKRIDEVFTGEIADETMKKLSILFQTGMPQFAYYDMEINHEKLYFESRMVKQSDSLALSIVRDITRQRREEALLQARLRLIEFSADATIEELLRETLKELEGLTGSQIGFYHFVDESTQSIELQVWSERTLPHFCKVEQEFSRHYPIEDAGVWVDCLKERETIIHNDYASLPNKKGLPMGHAVVIREMVVPLFRKNKIVSILGVGNKKGNYTNEDAEMVTRLSDMVWDIIESKRADEALMLSEERYRLLFENMAQGFTLNEIITDENNVPVDFKYLSINPAFEKQTGVLAKNAVGKTVKDVFPKIEQYWIDVFGKVALSGNPIQYVNYFEENERYYDTWVFCPKKGLFAAVFSDVSEKINADAQIKKLSKAIAQSPVAVIITDVKGDIEYVNPRFSDLTGYSQSEVMGKNPRLLQSGMHDKGFYKEMWEALNSGNDWKGIMVNRKKSGELYWESALITPLKDDAGNTVNYVALKEDITERFIADSKLRKSEEKFRLIYEKSPVGIFLLNQNNVIVDYNDKALEIIDVPANELMGVDLNRNPDERVLNAVNLINKGQLIEFEGVFEADFLRKQLFIKVIISPVLNDEGQYEGAIGMIEDRSAHVQKEALVKQVQVAKESVKFKQNFLANMSHEIRTPLTGMMGMLEMFEKTSLDSQQTEYLNILKNTSDNLMEIINQVLDYSKIEAGKLSLKPVVFKFTELFDDVIKMFGGLCVKKGIEFRTRISIPDVEYLKADKSRIVQVINNFLTNAIKFTKEGYVEISASAALLTENQSYFDFLRHKDANLLLMKIEVNDTGIGIPSEKQKILFRPFSQIDEADNRIYEGTGLGLSICKQLVEMHGGEIGMRSEPGKGSSFWFSFVAGVVNELDVSETSRPSSFSIIERNLNILLAEDKKVNQKVISLMLASLGHTVTVADNGQEVLDKFAEGAFDLILMDIQMPVMDGITATQKLKESGNILPPIVGLSANAFEGDKEKYMSKGMDDYLTKPVKTADFVELLHRLF